MELPVQFTQTNLLFNHIQEYTHKIINPFLQEDDTKVSQFIMPLWQVEKQLHQHYVSRKPLSITYEFYNSQQEITQSTITVYVSSTIRTDRRIILNELDSKRHLILNLDQILRVSANTF